MFASLQVKANKTKSAAEEKPKPAAKPKEAEKPKAAAKPKKEGNKPEKAVSKPKEAKAKKVSELTACLMPVLPVMSVCTIQERWCRYAGRGQAQG